MIFPRQLLRYELLRVEIRTLDFYNLDSSAIFGSLPTYLEHIMKGANEAMVKRCINESCVMSTIGNLDLEHKNSFLTKEALLDISVDRLHLCPSYLKYLFKKDQHLGMHAWTGDLLEELLQKISLCEDTSKALSSVLNVIDKVNYCRYLPLDVIRSRLEKYLQFAIRKFNADWLNGTFRKQIVDIVKVFVVRKDVYRDFIINCPIDLKTFLMCAQLEKFETWGLWSNTEDAEYEATRFCFEHNVENLITFLRFGGRSTYCWLSLEDLAFCFFDEIEPIDEKKFHDLYDILSDGPQKLTNFRVLQVLRLYLKNFAGTPQESVEAMKWLWGSITNPFLIYEDFMLIVDNIPEGHRGKVVQCWTWYEKHVSNSVQRNPRTLMHLSRCTIRSRLAQNFNLPNRVKELHLPKELLLYIERPDVYIL